MLRPGALQDARAITTEAADALARHRTNDRKTVAAYSHFESSGGDDRVTIPADRKTLALETSAGSRLPDRRRRCQSKPYPLRAYYIVPAVFTAGQPVSCGAAPRALTRRADRTGGTAHGRVDGWTGGRRAAEDRGSPSYFRNRRLDVSGCARPSLRRL